MILISVADKQP